MATYEDGEFRGNDPLPEAPDSLEGADERRILDALDGPDLIAVRPE